MSSHRKSGIFLLCLLSLAACAQATVTVTAPVTTATATATPAANLTTVDWMNFTYHNSCVFSPATTPTPAMLTVHNGKSAPFPNGDIFVVYTPIYGNVTGSGQPDAVIPNDCIGGQPRGKQFDVYSGTAAQPQYLGHLPLASDPQPDISIGDPSRVSFGGNHTLILGGLGYSSDAIPVCCPDLSITDTFTWQTNQFVLTNQQHAPFVTPTP